MTHASIQEYFSFQVSKIYTIAIACFVLLAACKKENKEQPQYSSFEKERIKTMTGADDYEGFQQVYIYDEQKRVIKEIEILWGTDTAKITDYDYSGNKVTIKITEANSIRYINYQLNPQGYRMSDTTTDGTIYTYEYDSKGFLAKTYDNQTPRYERVFFYNPKTSLLDSTHSIIGGMWSNSQTYEYDMNRKNSLDDKNFGKLYYGNSAILRPYTRYTYKYLDNGVIKTQVTDYLYTYDEKGRIKTKSYESTGQKLSSHYTYY